MALIIATCTAAEPCRLASGGPKEPQATASGSLAWRTAKKRASNASYLAHRLNDINVSYTDVDRQHPTGDRGNTLAEVRDAAKALGLEAVVLQATPESLSRCPLPCIAHLEEERGATGHYVVV